MSTASTTTAKEEGEWVDVTSKLREELAVLDFANPMFQHPSFSLYDSMTAIEISDPKMDQCANLPPSVTVDSIFSATLPSQPSISFCVSLMLQVMRYEASFMNGASVLESTHRCLFLWERTWSQASNVDINGQAVLLFCRLVNKELDLYNKLVLHEDIYEDEDFQSATLAELFEQSEEELLETGKKLLSELQDQQMIAILQCQITKLKLFSLLTQWVTKQQRVRKITSDNEAAAMVEAQSQLTVLLGLVEETIASVRQLKDNQSIAQQQQEQDDISSSAFSDTLVRLIQIAPVRQIVHKSLSDSLQSIIDIFSHVKTTLEVGLEFCVASTRTFDALFAKIVDMSRKRYHLLSRCVLKSVIEAMAVSGQSMVTQSISSQGVSRATLETDFIKERWLPTAALLCMETLTTLTMNRNKLLKHLESTLTHWGARVQEANFIHTKLLPTKTTTTTTAAKSNEADNSSPVLSWWVSQWVTAVMDVYMELLVELLLLSTGELKFFFWYWEHILATRVHALQNLRKYQAEQQQLQLQQPQKKGKKNTTPVVPPPKVPFTAEECLLRSRCHIYHSQVQLLLLADKLQLTSSFDSVTRFSSWERIFIERFAAFQTVPEPPPLPYSLFPGHKLNNNDNNNNNNNSKTLLDLADWTLSGFTQAKQYLDTFRDTQHKQAALIDVPVLSVADQLARDQANPLLKAIVTTSVHLTKVKSTFSTTTTTTTTTKYSLTLNTKIHPHLPVVEIKVLV